MHLAVNAIRFTRTFTGVGRYMECVLNEWSRMDLPFDRITLYTHTPLEQSGLTFPLDRFEQRVVGRRVPDPIWELTALRRCADDVDVLFAPSYTVPVGWRGRCLVTYLGPPEFTPGTLKWWRWRAYEMLYRYSVHKADRVCAISQAVKNRLLDVYKVPERKIGITYLAAGEAFRPIGEQSLLDKARRRYVPGDEPFMLFVGKLAKRHYIPNLLRAFAELKRIERIPHRLVLVGPDYLKLNVPARAERLGVADSVTHVPYIFHADLPPLYNAAEFFVYPASDAEGFGIPVVEAMACGTPVLTVNRGSLREIAPGASLMTGSSDSNELRDAMRRMISDKPLRDELSALGPERARQFSWRETAERTMDTLWQLANLSEQEQEQE